MLIERWRKIESIFHSVLARAPEHRDDYLNDACGSDHTLRCEIDELLAADDRTCNPLDTPALAEGLGLLEKPSWLRVGDRLGRYKILAGLGAGGMGEVYLASDPELGRKVAIKVLLPAFAADTERMQRLSLEGRMASALNHPNILTVYDIGEIGGRPYLVIEFVQGVTLRTRLRKGPVPVEEAVRTVTQAAEALRAAHAAQIVHRDIKPENLMLRPDGLLKVLDFGIAKVLGRGLSGIPTTVVTEPGKIAGSLAYMSPEQISGHELDGRTDIWSLGVVLYEMLTNQVPFSGTTPNQVAVAILENRVPPLPSDIPPSVAAVIQKALQDKDQRYSSAADLLDGLQAVVLSNPPVRSSREPPSRPRIIRRPGWVIAPVLVVALLYSLSFWLSRQGPTTLYEQMLPLTNEGNVIIAAISHDGRYLAFTTDSGQEQRLWLRQISTESNSLRASSEVLAFGALTFSRDNKHLYYVAETHDGVGELVRLPLIGGEARRLIHDVDGPVALSPDGGRIAFLRHDLERSLTKLMLAESDGSSERELAARALTEGFLDGSLAWSPDGSVIASASWGVSSGKRQAVLSGIHVASGGQRELSAHRWAWIEGLHWVNGELFILGTKDDISPASHIFRLSIETGAITRVTNDAAGYSSLSVTRDSNVVAVQKLRTSAIWTLDFASPAQARRITPPGSQYLGISWVNKHQMLTRANVGGLPKGWLISADSASVQTLNEAAAEQRNPRMCGDGHIVFSSVRTGNWKIWHSQIDGRNLRQVTTGTSTDGGAVCTPDGRWVLFNSDRTGSTTLWRVPIAGGPPEQLTPEMSYFPEISADGKLIACILHGSAAAKEGVVAVLPITGGAPLRRLKSIPPSSYVRWGPRGQMLTFTRTRQNVSNIFIQDAFDNQQQQLTHFDTDQIFSFDWSRDGSTLAMVRGVNMRNAVMIASSTN